MNWFMVIVLIAIGEILACVELAAAYALYKIIENRKFREKFLEAEFDETELYLKNKLLRANNNRLRAELAKLEKEKDEEIFPLRNKEETKNE